MSKNYRLLASYGQAVSAIQHTLPHRPSFPGTTTWQRNCSLFERTLQLLTNRPFKGEDMENQLYKRVGP